MTLGFKTFINNEPTNFIEKIWASLLELDEELFSDYLNPDGRPLIVPSEQICKTFNPKLHTIREDKNNRWKPGNDIHFVIKNRTKYRFQFAPVIKCISVQDIQIDYQEEACEWYGIEPVISIDKKILNVDEFYELAKNDGFDSVQDFLDYFNKDFKGKIIHWTNHKY